MVAKIHFSGLTKEFFPFVKLVQFVVELETESRVAI